MTRAVSLILELSVTGVPECLKGCINVPDIASNYPEYTGFTGPLL